ncbi:MAG: 7-cyano-7-deazaguanine synthase [Methanothrix sp.]|jgi:tRNA U34 2-thiouridine synthase MnmA/TrmU|nr:7-cyano-7-deazaguanine synthase [Methanothrix sp.]
MKAIILLSGGLDSTLAAELMSREGLELLAVNFKTPFCLCDRHSSNLGCGSNARRVAEAIGIDLKVINATKDFLEVLKKPEHGYGANMNPCIDCRILFFRKSKELMEEVGASFIITGEVLGQRPMSQFRRQMNIIEKEADLDGLVLRPLSAKLLAPTIPEKNGWISRERMLDIAGRSRKPQMALAKNLGINDYPCAAGGCLLTDPEFANRIRDLIKHDELDMQKIELLKAGRYFRLSPSEKLIVGRNENENKMLTLLAKEGDYLFGPATINGPIAVGMGTFEPDLLEVACRIVARYSDRDGEVDADISYKRLPDSKGKMIKASFLDEEELAKLRTLIAAA